MGEYIIQNVVIKLINKDNKLKNIKVCNKFSNEYFVK